MFFGVDLTSAPTKLSACFGLDKELGVAYLGFLADDSDIIDVIDLYLPEAIAIDAPLTLPHGLCCLEESCSCQEESQWKNRQCDRELRREGIPCYPTTKKTFIKDLIRRGIELRSELSWRGYQVIEVYPYASKVRLFGKAMPVKTTSQGIAFLRERLEGLLPRLKPYLGMLDHNLCDAVLAAYTAFLYRQGSVDVLGDSKEGLIFVPS